MRNRQFWGVNFLLGKEKTGQRRVFVYTVMKFEVKAGVELYP